MNDTAVSLSQTAYAYLQSLVERGEYAAVDDAVTDLIMQFRRAVGTPTAAAAELPTVPAAAPTPQLSSRFKLN